MDKGREGIENWQKCVDILYGWPYIKIIKEYIIDESGRVNCIYIVLQGPGCVILQGPGRAILQGPGRAILQGPGCAILLLY